MCIDEGVLRAYLDGEGTVAEREIVEQYLTAWPEGPAALARLRQEREGVHRLLALLTPPAGATSSAGAALKRFQAQLGPGSSRDSRPAQNSSLTVWESPSLLAELKSDVKHMRYTWRKTVTKGFILATGVSLIIVISTLALAVWPNIGLEVTEGLQQAAPSEEVNLTEVWVDPAAPDISQLPTEAVPVSAVFNNEIELVGYKLQTKDGIDLTLYWRSLQEVAQDYTVFVHLTDAQGQLLSGEDSPPVQGQAPTSRWQINQVIEDRHHLQMSENFPPGKYDLSVGLYNSTTGERLLVQGADITSGDNLLLTKVEVGEVLLVFNYGIQADPNGDSQLNIGAVKELGFEWVKFQMPWKAVEPTQGSYDWAAWDTVIEAYAAQNIKVMLHIVKAPDWARPANDDKSVDGPPANLADYAGFVAEVARRYRDKVQAVEIWDEQNLWYKAGGKGRINAAAYVELLQQAYPAIKAANPNMLVISGGLTPAENVDNLALDDVEYLKQMYANGVKGYFDALGAHPAGTNCPALADWRTVTPAEAGAEVFLEPFTRRHHSWCFLGTMEAYREVMLSNNDGGRAIAITQFGWAVGDSPQPGYTFALDNTPAERARWLVEAYQWAKKQGWVGPMVLWNLDYSLTTPVTELGYFSIYYTSAYEALVEMPK